MRSFLLTIFLFSFNCVGGKICISSEVVFNKWKQHCAMGVVLGLCSHRTAHSTFDSHAQNVDVVVQTANAMKDKLAHDSTVFGAKLDVVSRSIDQMNLYDLSDFKVEDPVEIPDVLLACIGYLKKDQRLKVRGLFRIPGDHFFILKLKQDISVIKNEPVTVDTLESLHAESHAVANVLKSFLKDLAEPLLTYSQFVEVGKSSEIEFARLEELLDSLPILNKVQLLIRVC